MQIREFSKPVTSKQLNESLAKKFGYSINFEQFSDVQLEDARNKLRTKLSQFEVNESFDSIHESPEYQKTRMFLDCINQEIMEREEGKCPDCHSDPCECDDEEDKEEKSKKDESVARAVGIRATALSIPNNWINSAINRIQLGETDREELAAELKLRYDLNESQTSWVLLEGEEEKAETIMGTKDMVDRITGWLEDVAAMKAEQLLELLDSIRETAGSDIASQYEQAVKPALEAIYTALETSRTGLSQGLALVSGGEAPTMGAGPTPAPTAGASAPEGTPEMGGEELPPSAEAGREKRESVDYSRRLGLLLASNSKKK